jgi:5-methylcytosine-specific restriction protein A
MKTARPWQHLYWSSKWKAINRERLRREPWCRYCLQDGRHTKATIVDHITPHKGSAALFFSLDNTQSLCKRCHDGAKHAEDARGFSRKIGDDGWPIDARHPANAGKLRK